MQVLTGLQLKRPSRWPETLMNLVNEIILYRQTFWLTIDDGADQSPQCLGDDHQTPMLGGCCAVMPNTIPKVRLGGGVT